MIGVVFALQWVAPRGGARREPWILRGVLRRTAGAPVLSALAIEHRDDPTCEVTGWILRGINAATIRDKALQWAASRLEYIDVIARGGYLAPADIAHAEWVAGEATRKRGRPGKGDEHYMRIAVRYLELIMPATAAKC